MAERVIIDNVKLRIELSGNKDRAILFDRICELLNISATKNKEKLNVKSAIPSYDSLFKLLIQEKLPFQYEPKEGKLTTWCPKVQPQGGSLINQPHKVSETKVDTQKVIDVEKDGFKTIEVSEDIFDDDDEDPLK
jgi:DNA topoisomerase VI subunit A